MHQRGIQSNSRFTKLKYESNGTHSRQNAFGETTRDMPRQQTVKQKMSRMTNKTTERQRAYKQLLQKPNKGRLTIWSMEK